MALTRFLPQLAIASAVSAAIVSLPGFSAEAAALKFDGTGILFDKDTTVEFSFISSQGAFQSSIGVVLASDPTTTLSTLLAENPPGYDEPVTGDFAGTCGITISLPCTASFTFLAGQDYSLVLDSGLDGKVYSTDALNTLGPQAIFSGTDIFAGLTVGFEDSPSPAGGDFNDFQIGAIATAAVPEPVSTLALGLIGGSLLLSRRGFRRST